MRKTALSLIFTISTIALGQTKDAPKIGDALRCENGKCVSKPADSPVIVQLIRELGEKELRIRQQEARIRDMEKAQAAKSVKGRKAK